MLEFLLHCFLKFISFKNHALETCGVTWLVLENCLTFVRVLG
jgi:hypothetical protein